MNLYRPTAVILVLALLLAMMPVYTQESENGYGSKEPEEITRPRQLEGDLSRQILHMEDYMPFPGDEYLLLIDFGAAQGGESPLVQYPLILQNDYSIEIPVIGTMDAEGLSFTELREEVISRVKKALLLDYADFRLSKPAPFEIMVYGSVYFPGWTMANSFTRLTEVVDYAGGFTENGSIRRVSVLSETSRRTYDLLDFYTHGETAENPYVRPGDRIFIPEIESFVNLTGAVVEPGIYEILPDETLNDIIALAGGLDPAAQISEAYALRVGENSRYERLDFDKLQEANPADLVLKSGDRISIPSAEDAHEKVIAEGALYGQPQEGETPRAVPTSAVRYALTYRPGMTLLSVLKQMGGPTPFAVPEDSFILRTETGERIPVPFLEELWDSKEANRDMTLLPGDYLVVPITNMNVLVSGEVVSGGSFGYVNGYTVRDYLERARGIHPDRGSDSKIYIITPDREKTKVYLDTPVKPGDHILVGKNLWAGTQKAMSNILVVTGWAAGIIGVATTVINFIADTLPKVTN
ncbi:MAG: SLBB domain-containing protein [Spirochaetia bacterium]